MSRIKTSDVSVQIGFPPLSISGNFVPTKAEQLCACELLVELASRTSSAPLLPATGIIREALSSLYKLYDITRNAFKKPDIATTHRTGNFHLG
jgi:hypothetical protein